MERVNLDHPNDRLSKQPCFFCTLICLMALGTFCFLPSCSVDEPIYPDEQYGWIPQASGTSLDLCDVFFVNRTDGVIVGADGLVLKTENAGIDWQLMTSGTNNYLRDVFFINKYLGFALSVQGNILKTTNGGEPGP